MYVLNSQRLGTSGISGAPTPNGPLPPNGSLENASSATRVVLVDHRRFLRECVVRSLVDLSSFEVLPYATVADWLAGGDGVEASVIMLLAGGRSRREVLADFDLLERAGNTLPIVLVSQVEGLEAIMEIVGRGARAYVPTSMSVEIAIEVVKLVKAGGTYVPAHCVMAAPRSPDPAPSTLHLGDKTFTNRQAAVIEALRSGKANKVIAFELKMRESTVKVHVRNIMRKLNARNRTEVAILANAIDAGATRHASNWTTA